MMQKIVLAIILVLFSWSGGHSAETTYPALSGQVVDEAGVLTPQDKTRLLELLSKDKDNQVAVAIVNDLRGHSGREYGIELARRWQLGQKGKDNGVLILLAVKDRYAGIEVGYGLEGILPDSLAGRIMREEIFPPLQRDLDYGTAAYNGAAAVMTVLGGGTLPERQAGEGDPFDEAFSMLMTLIMIYLVLSGRWRPGGGRGFLYRGGRGSGGGFRGGGGGFGGGGAGGRF